MTVTTIIVMYVEGLDKSLDDQVVVIRHLLEAVGVDCSCTKFVGTINDQYCQRCGHAWGRHK